MTLEIIAPLFGLGIVAGFAAGLLGIGGSMIMVPFMIIALERSGFSQAVQIKVAIATSLATILFTSISSVRAHHQRGAVLWPIVKMMAPGLVVGSLLGAQLATRFNSAWLTLGFGVFMVYVATQMVFKKPSPAGTTMPSPLTCFSVSSAIGVVSAIVGAGGGFMSVPFMVRSNIKLHQAAGTSAALGFPIALAGTIGYFLAPIATPLPNGTLGYIYVPALISVAAASVLTAPLGAKAAQVLPNSLMKKIFAGMLYSMGAFMLYKAWAVMHGH